MVTLETLLLSPVPELPRCRITPTLTEALQRLKASNADPRDLASHVERDPELAERLVAAMAHRTGRRVQDVLGGLRLVGLKALENLLMDMVEEGAHGLDPTLGKLLRGELLDHCLTVALASYLIAVETGYPQPSEAYAAGLLHDLGLALLEAFPCGDLSDALQLSQAESMALSTPEDARMGGNHAYMGSKLLEHWQLPPSIVAAVAHHHAPQQAQTSRRLATIVYLAETVITCRQAEASVGSLAADAMVLAGLRLTPDRLLMIAERAIEHHASHLRSTPGSVAWSPTTDQ